MSDDIWKKAFICLAGLSILACAVMYEDRTSGTGTGASTCPCGCATCADCGPTNVPTPAPSPITPTLAPTPTPRADLSPDTRFPESEPCWRYDVCSKECLCKIGSYYCASPDHSAPCAAGDALRCYCLNARWAKDYYSFNLSRSDVVLVVNRTWNGTTSRFPVRRFCLSNGTKALPYNDNEVYNLAYYPIFFRASKAYWRCG